MKLKQNKSGFTLLEIIIVIIIVGVLASLALPRFFATVEFSKSTEALNAMGVLRGSMERCYLASAGTYATCALASLDVEDPSTTPGTRFAYALVGAPSATAYTITATRNATDGGDGVSTITITQTAGVVTRTGTGKFVGIK
ncbi:MAG: prepilin-type N-terminal cleavage/methylation domain-containing protein [Candidatus Omnitrophica bacterium]|nr:prepilin-type N-terminal cleavage/methylation domain-containing protein [Candidatus Omnitrophota bacterium]